MKYYATALKSIFSDLINFDISNSLAYDHQLKQDMLENVWSAIYGLDKDPSHKHEIDGIVDLLNDAIVYLDEMKTIRGKSGLKSYIKETIQRIEETR